MSDLSVTIRTLQAQITMNTLIKNVWQSVTSRRDVEQSHNDSLDLPSLPTDYTALRSVFDLAHMYLDADLLRERLINTVDALVHDKSSVSRVC